MRVTKYGNGFTRRVYVVSGLHLPHPRYEILVKIILSACACRKTGPGIIINSGHLRVNDVYGVIYRDVPRYDIFVRTPL